MPARQLPPEHLIDIFSNLTSSPSALHPSLFVSRTFCKLVKPVLYRNVVITCNEDWGLLRRVKKEDEQLVKKVSILGNGPYHVHEWHDESDTYRETVQGSLGGCVRDLLAGNFLDISVIETLVIRNVGESPVSSFGPQVFKVASKLRELSIWTHQGGGDVWYSYLETKANLPNLRRLGLIGVTNYHQYAKDPDAVDEYDSDEEGFNVYEQYAPLPISLYYSELDILVAEPSTVLENFDNLPFDKFLALIRPPVTSESWSLSPLIKNCRIIDMLQGIGKSDAIAIKKLRPKTKTSDNVLHFFFSSRSRWADTTNQEILAQVESADIVLHGDDHNQEEEHSLIFTSFAQPTQSHAHSPKMPTSHLPPELITEIFSNLTSSPSDLYHSLLASRSFYALAKPFLYSHITITSNEDCELLRRVKEEDKQLVKKLTIIGHGLYDRKTYDPSRLVYEPPVFDPLAKCVRDLLAGKLLEISVIETLIIYDVGESPHPSRVVKSFKVASKLIELSIWRHQGGGDYWCSYLKNKTNLPSLRRLAFVEVSCYHEHVNDEDEDDEDDEDDENNSDAVDEYPSDRETLGEYQVSVSLPSSSLYPQLEVLIADPPSRLEEYENFPFNNFLALLHPDSEDMRSREVNVVKNLRPKSNNPDNLLHFFFFGRRWKDKDLRKSQDIIARIESADVMVHEYDQDEEEEWEEKSTSRIFPWFVKYIRESRRLA
ncbi:hypothetical protein JCM5350_004500 [Sporobolomyces pararoseus]